MIAQPCGTQTGAQEVFVFLTFGDLESVNVVTGKEHVLVPPDHDRPTRLNIDLAVPNIYPY